MDDSVTLLTFEAEPRAVWSDADRVYYPQVRLLLNGQFQGETQYIMGFEDEATALVMAKSFADEEWHG